MQYEQYDPEMEILQRLRRWQNDGKLPEDVPQLIDRVVRSSHQNRHVLIVTWILNHLQHMVRWPIAFPTYIDADFTLNLMGQFETLRYVIPTRRARMNDAIRTILYYLQQHTAI